MQAKKDDFSLQDFADYWAKQQFTRFKKHLKIAFLKGNKYKRKISNHDWQGEAKKIESAYFANKALYFGASKDLPFKTLVLLGQILGEKAVSDEVKLIIEKNVIKYQGQYFKLDDSEKQTKIRKILRTYQFEQLDNFNQVA